MEEFFQPDSPGTGIVLGLAGVVFALAIRLVTGGFKVGKHTRNLDVVMPTEQLPLFVERMNHRLDELGFRVEQPDRVYKQGSVGRSVQLDTLASTPKQIEVLTEPIGAHQTRVQFSLQISSLFILGETGETAYSDAVLRYISNESDSMKVIPSCASSAYLSVVLGAWTWFLIIGFGLLKMNPPLITIFALGGGVTILGVIAIVLITINPRELYGVLHALGGIILGISAFILSWVLWR